MISGGWGLGLFWLRELRTTDIVISKHLYMNTDS